MLHNSHTPLPNYKTVCVFLSRRSNTAIKDAFQLKRARLSILKHANVLLK